MSIYLNNLSITNAILGHEAIYVNDYTKLDTFNSALGFYGQSITTDPQTVDWTTPNWSTSSAFGYGIMVFTLYIENSSTFAAQDMPTITDLSGVPLTVNFAGMVQSVVTYYSTIAMFYIIAPVSSFTARNFQIVFPTW